MILPISNHNSSIKFSSEQKQAEEKKLPYTEDTLLKNNFFTRMRIGMDKFTNALTVYPVKGLKGSKNSNFYEFLTMGTIPYIVGSGMLMAVFNYRKGFLPRNKAAAADIGKKLALGVLFYGLMKEVSKTFVTKPVQMLTGVDTTVPYAKYIYELPEYVDDTDITSIEYHQAMESVEFPRWDLFYEKENSGKPRNDKYDKIAKKLGMGDNLNDSDQEVKPRIKEILVKTMAAKNLSSYLWAATGVCVAFQKPWEKFFATKGFKESTKQFGISLWNSMKDFYRGEGSGIAKHGGKLLLGAAVLSSVLGVVNVMSSSQKPSKLDSADIIEKDRKYVVN